MTGSAEAVATGTGADEEAGDADGASRPQASSVSAARHPDATCHGEGRTPRA